MIFVTVGSMFPFDRLIRLMDDWTAAHPGDDVLAQIGDGAFEPVHMRWTRRLHPRAFADTVRKSSLIVAHAGMGSVFTASEFDRPIVILPRNREAGEHTTDHQIDTAHWLKARPGIFAVQMDGRDLAAQIEQAREAGVKGEMLPRSADPAFLQKIRTAITG